MRAFLLGLFACLLAAAPARATALVEALLKEETVTCDAVALDGDTLLCSLTAPEAFAGRALRVRLWGVAAPEMRETEGWHSRAVLDDLHAALQPEGAPLEAIDAAVDCTPKARHKSRLVAVCRTEADRDLAEAVIAAGWATEHRAFTREGHRADPALADRYAAAERTARAEGVGVWAATIPSTTRDSSVMAAWAQAILSAAAVIAAALMAQWFGRKLHNDNIEREQAAERRIARNHMLPVVLAWSSAQDLAGKMVAAMEQLRLVKNEGGVNDKRYQNALTALDEATKLAEAEFGGLEIPRDARTYLRLEELDGLVGGKMYGEAGTRDARKAVDAMSRLRDSTNNPRNYRANPDFTPQKLEELGQRHLESGIEQLKTSHVHIRWVIEGLVGPDRTASNGEPAAKRS